MPRPVSEQVVVIVGASSGIGRATALAFAARGAEVVCAARGERALDTLVEEIREACGSAIAVPTDVADPAAVRVLAEAAEQRYGRIDTWVNGAAVGVLVKPPPPGPAGGRPGRVHGSHPGRVLRHSVLTRLVGRRPRPGERAGTLVRRWHRRTPARPDPAV